MTAAAPANHTRSAIPPIVINRRRRRPVSGSIATKTDGGAEDADRDLRKLLRCGHRGTVSADTLERYGLSPNVTLAYLSRMVRCEGCGSHAVKLERCEAIEAQAFVAKTGSSR